MFLLFEPSGYKNAKVLNKLTSSEPVDAMRASAQHAALRRALRSPAFPAPSTPDLPDLVYSANAGLFLPRLPEPVVLVSKMAHAERARESPHVREVLKNIGVVPVDYTGAAPWEGQGECIWFLGGRLLVLGYGYRSTAATVPRLRAVLHRVYASYGVEPPAVLGLRLTSPKVYHLDIAMCKFGETKGLLRRGAVEGRHLRALERYGVTVTELDLSDPFALNMIVLGRTAVTHRHVDPRDREALRPFFSQLVEVDVSEFEKGGGSVQCLALRLF